MKKDRCMGSGLFLYGSKDLIQNASFSVRYAFSSLMGRRT